MEIYKFNAYLDGGTIEIETDQGTFCFDGRIKSNTKGMLYRGYPEKDNSNLIQKSDNLEREIISALKEHKDPFYQNAINRFIKSKTK